MRGCCASAASSALEDGAGTQWSATNYPGGYTSYSSLARMHQMSPTFAALEKRIDCACAHVRAHARFRPHRAQAGDDGLLGQRDDAAGGAWPAPASAGELSGTYYVRTPRGCSGLKFEDPRLDRFMASPPRKARARRENQVWVTVPAEQGNLVLFESWLRHEVAPNPTEAERISISFNYSWF